ncbi:RNA methyltransferase [Siccirubricoccus sp. KC 17139]|uniref:RNA methyltransferase n=1 Tax=Siccirubricoccus soli TaxID=2899147 RepID=A0ABT1D1T6_9PROT|nr:RNA methyltransferase [Siccirubricoccus soli]MCO6415881.1 RNA methyltransferase [Siccirubricoccus soli]MCP2682013.1 RNA methyltransferase [Siccirubricoccus soli]
MIEDRLALHTRPRPAPEGPGPDRQSRICGVAPVQALFLRRADQVARLFYVPERRGVAGPLCAYLARKRRPYREVPAEELERIAGTQHHGGICAIAARRVAEPLAGPLPEGVRAAMLHPVLDGIGNPHNLGAIARSAAFLGCRALFLTMDPRQAELSDAAFRTAEGGLEHLAVHRLPGLASLPAALGRPVLTVAAVAAGGQPPEALPRDRPIALVLGNEEQGLRPETLAACEARVTLPGSGLVESLNVSAAAAVLLYALRPRG